MSVQYGEAFFSAGPWDASAVNESPSGVGVVFSLAIAFYIDITPADAALWNSDGSGADDGFRIITDDAGNVVFAWNDTTTGQTTVPGAQLGSGWAIIGVICDALGDVTLFLNGAIVGFAAGVFNGIVAPGGALGDRIEADTPLFAVNGWGFSLSDIGRDDMRVISSGFQIFGRLSLDPAGGIGLLDNYWSSTTGDPARNNTPLPNQGIAPSTAMTFVAPPGAAIFTVARSLGITNFAGNIAAGGGGG